MTQTLDRPTDVRRPTDLGVVDCDVHPILPPGDPLRDYIPAEWRQRVEGIDLNHVELDGPRLRKLNDTTRVENTPPNGGLPGSDPHFLLKDHIEPKNVMYALLLPYNGGRLGAWVDADEAAMFAEAYNRFNADHWLFDPRFRLAMVVSPIDPLLAAAEIRRFGRTPGVTGVWLPLIGTLLGNRFFRPIYEAASDVGLPILLHGIGGSFQGMPARAGGLPENHAEAYSMLANGGISSNNLSSLIFTGTFERFPELKVVFCEMGWTWVGPAMWKMDRAWRSERPLVPWLKKPPTDYVLEHVRFTTQPMDDPNPREYLVQAARMMHAERTLLFSSDYPHWDGDDPKLAFAGFPDDLKHRIFRENALDTFGSLMPRIAEG